MRCGCLFYLALATRRSYITGPPASTRLYGCFPAGLLCGKCAAEAHRIPTRFLCCFLTLAASLRLGGILLICLAVFLLAACLSSFCVVTAVAAASGCMGRRTADICRSSKAFSGSFESSASRVLAHTGALANACCRLSCQSQGAADSTCRAFCYHRKGRAEYGIGNHARER